MKRCVCVLILLCLLLGSFSSAAEESEPVCGSHEYLFVSSGFVTCFVTVENSTDVALSVSGHCTASDTEGNPLPARSMSIPVLGPGEESVGVFRFDGAVEPSSVSCELSCTVVDTEPVLSSLRLDPYPNEEGVTVLVTNTGAVPAVNPVVYSLFFDEEDMLLSYAYSYLTDYDDRLKPGASMAEQMNAAGPFDHCRLYLSAQPFEGSYTPAPAAVSMADLRFKEYVQKTPLSTTHYVAVTSRADIPVGMHANAVAYDAEGNVRGAANALIDVLAPGEETVAVFTFYYVTDCAYIDFTVFFDESPAVRSAVGDLDTKLTYAGEDIQVTVTNTGEKPVRYAYLTVLFADETGAAVYVETLYCADEEGELKPGAAVTRTVSPGVNYEAIELYVSGETDL